MAVYRRGGVWWYEFQFRGQRVRESSYSSNKSVALRIERERHRSLELGTAGLKETQEPLLFATASKNWLESNKAHWSASNLRIESFSLGHLQPHFGRLLLADITPEDVARYQAKRKSEDASPRTINMEIGTLRAILRKHRLWANIQPDVRMLRVKQDTGRALSDDEQHRLLVAAKATRSRSLPVAIQVALHTGLRNSELRLLRWRQVDLIERSLIVGRSKTAGGEGRLVPLSQTAARTLVEWRREFPDAQPEHFVFPSERYGLEGDKGRTLGRVVPYDIDPKKPIGSWKVSWTKARELAKVSCRWHDMRHKFVSKMAEGLASDATIMALAGHLSRRMMERYSHVRGEAKRQAIAVFDGDVRKPAVGSRGKKSPHKSPHSAKSQTSGLRATA
jgi:integrase